MAEIDRHEPDAPRALLIGLVVVGVFAATGLILGGVGAVGGWRAPGPRVPPPEIAPHVEHWAEPARWLAEVRAEERRALGEWAWVDSARTHARIPIERAVELTERRGEWGGGR